MSLPELEGHELEDLAMQHALIAGALRRRNEMIVSLYHRGVPVRRMASALGLSAKAIYLVLEQEGIER